MLCVLHEIGLHRREDGSIDKSSFKIVYVAPMKALVAEMVGNFSKRLEPYGIQVRGLRGVMASMQRCTLSAAAWMRYAAFLPSIREGCK